MLLCLDRLDIAWTRGSSISFWFISSKIITIGWSDFYSCGYFVSSIDSYVSVSVSDFSKSPLLTISSIATLISSSFKMCGFIWIGM